MALRLVFLGTGTFALPAFLALVDSEHEVAALVTQPDRTGRGHHRHLNEIKDAALAVGIDVFQPENAGTDVALERLRSYAADLFVVAAYGQILTEELLAIPRLGAVNLHASLLPKYRGAAPIHYAILNGETRTGVCVFQIVRELDAGPVLGCVETEIGPEETSGDLETRLADLAGPLILQTTAELEAGTAVAVPQDHSRATFAPKMRKSLGQIDWSQPSERIQCHIRAMQPWPMPFTFLHDGSGNPIRLLILEVADPRPTSTVSGAPGQLTVDNEGRLLVATGDRALAVTRLQPAGKKPMTAADFLRGHAIGAEHRFGPES